MNTPVRIGVLSLIASISMLHGAAHSSAPAEQQPSNAAAAAAITSNVGEIVSTAANLVQHHDKQTILASVGQLLQSIFSIVATLVHKGNAEEAALEPMVVEVREALVERLVDAIDCSREYLKHVSLQELGCALQDAEREAIQMCASRAENAPVDENENNVIDVLNALIHDLFAIIQSSGEDAHIGASIADMLSNIVELATDTIKYERADDMEACAAMYVDRVCAELNRQIRHLMVQSALTLRGSSCSVACCKNPGRPCAAAINMILGTRNNNGCGCCKPCAKPKCNSCSTCNSCSQNTNSCCCGRRSMSDICNEEEVRSGCGCNSECSTCKPGCNCRAMDMEMTDADMRSGCSCGCKPTCNTCKPGCNSCKFMETADEEMRSGCGCGCKPASCTTCCKPKCSCKSMDICSMDMCDSEEMRGCGCGCKPASCTTCNKPRPLARPTVQAQAAAAESAMMAASANVFKPVTAQNSPQIPQLIIAAELVEPVIIKCPCNNKPRPLARPTVQAQAAAAETMAASAMMTASASAVKPAPVIIKCPCNNRPNQKITQNSPQLPVARPQLTPSRKDGHRVLPEGHGQRRRRNMR